MKWTLLLYSLPYDAKILPYYTLRSRGEKMRINTTERRKWQERRNRKNERLRNRRAKNDSVSQNTHYSYRTKTEKNRSRLIAPTQFSICNNPDELVEYFSLYLNKARMPKLHKRLYCDMSGIKDITADAIMYLIATIDNARSISEKISKTPCYVTGNAPREEGPKTKLFNSGFLDYVNSNVPELKPSKEHFHIVSGNIVDPRTAMLVCDHINYFCDTDVPFTRALYKMIIEMMQNTVDHAYGNIASGMLARWYAAVENMDEYVRFVFLDTGEGIPNTIRKRIVEKFLHKYEYEYMASAFSGEFRSSTKLRTRGKGLPTILECVDRNNYKRLVVVSGNGYYEYDVDKKTHTGHDISKNFQGTLFTFDVPKPTRNEAIA